MRNNNKKTSGGSISAKNIVFFFPFAVLPVFYLPITKEYFETAKILFLLFCTLCLFLYWALNTKKNNKLVYIKSKLYKPFGILIGVVLISFLLSQDQQISLRGYYGRLLNSVFFYFTICLFFIGLINVIKDEKASITSILIGLVFGIDLLAFYSIITNVGVVSGLLGSFSLDIHPVGSVFIIPFVYLIGALLATVIYGDGKISVKSVFSLVSIVICTISFGVVSGSFETGENWRYFVFLLFSVVSMFFFSWKDFLLKKRSVLAVFLISSLIISFCISNISSVRELLQITVNTSTDGTILEYGHNWDVIVSSLSSSFKNGLVGTGPDTFVEAFSRFRPLEFNQLSYWGIRFTRGANEIMEVFTNLGILGVCAIGLLIFQVIKIVTYVGGKKWKKSFEYKILASISLSLMILMILTIYNTLLWIIFIVTIIAFELFRRDLRGRQEENVVHIISVVNENYKSVQDKLPEAFIILTLSIFALLFWGVLKSYIPDVYYYKSIKAFSNGDLVESLNQNSKAIDLDSKKDYYHIQAASSSLLRLKESRLDDSISKEVQENYVNQVIIQTEEALRRGDSNVENWEAAGIIYYELLSLTKSPLLLEACGRS